MLLVLSSKCLFYLGANCIINIFVTLPNLLTVLHDINLLQLSVQIVFQVRDLGHHEINYNQCIPEVLSLCPKNNAKSDETILN